MPPHSSYWRGAVWHSNVELNARWARAAWSTRSYRWCAGAVAPHPRETAWPAVG